MENLPALITAVASFVGSEFSSSRITRALEQANFDSEDAIALLLDGFGEDEEVVVHAPTKVACISEPTPVPSKLTPMTAVSLPTSQTHSQQQHHQKQPLQPKAVPLQQQQLLSVSQTSALKQGSNATVVKSSSSSSSSSFLPFTWPSASVVSERVPKHVVSLGIPHPSSVVRILGRGYESSDEDMQASANVTVARVLGDIQALCQSVASLSLLYPQNEIVPFDFKTLSPDELVREEKKKKPFGAKFLDQFDDEEARAKRLAKKPWVGGLPLDIDRAEWGLPPVSDAELREEERRQRIEHKRKMIDLDVVPSVSRCFLMGLSGSGRHQLVGYMLHEQDPSIGVKNAVRWTHKTNERQYTAQIQGPTKKFIFTSSRACGDVKSLMKQLCNTDVIVLVSSPQTFNAASPVLLEGLKQTLQLAQLCGVTNLVHCVSFMDLPTAWSKTRFQNLTTSIAHRLFKDTGYVPRSQLPVSGLSGDNWMDQKHDDLVSWYQGDTLMAALEKITPSSDVRLKPFRMRAISWHREVTENNAWLEVEGAIFSGSTVVGEPVLVVSGTEVVKAEITDILPNASSRNSPSIVLAGKQSSEISKLRFDLGVSDLTQKLDVFKESLLATTTKSIWVCEEHHPLTRLSSFPLKPNKEETKTPSVCSRFVAHASLCAVGAILSTSNSAKEATSSSAPTPDAAVRIGDLFSLTVLPVPQTLDGAFATELKSGTCGVRLSKVLGLVTPAIWTSSPSPKKEFVTGVLTEVEFEVVKDGSEKIWTDALPPLSRFVLKHNVEGASEMKTSHPHFCGAGRIVRFELS